ncbi:hypothetical protein ACRW1O_27240, partial [Escherichia coli]
SCCRFSPPFTIWHVAQTPTALQSQTASTQKKKTDLNHYERDHSARRKSMTERSERIDEEAEENR